MKCLVTGAAGFIASRLCLRLLQEGFSVIGIDCFTDYYARELKEQNLALLQTNKGFSFISEDINSLDLKKINPDDSGVSVTGAALRQLSQSYQDGAAKSLAPGSRYF